MSKTHKKKVESVRPFYIVCNEKMAKELEAYKSGFKDITIIWNSVPDDKAVKIPVDTFIGYLEMEGEFSEKAEGAFE